MELSKGGKYFHSEAEKYFLRKGCSCCEETQKGKRLSDPVFHQSEHDRGEEKRDQNYQQSAQRPAKRRHVLCAGKGLSERFCRKEDLWKLEQEQIRYHSKIIKGSRNTYECKIPKYNCRSDSEPQTGRKPGKE